MRIAFAVWGPVLIVCATSACSGTYRSDFSVVVANATTGAIRVLANGTEIGDVDAGSTGSFTLQLPESNANVFTNGVAPTAQAQVNVSARDVKTGALSSPKNLTLSRGSATAVTFGATDFPFSAPPVSIFTFAPSAPGVNQDVFFSSGGSTPTSGSFRWDFGDGGA